MIFLNGLIHTKPHMYANDTILSAASTSTIKLQLKLNQDLLNIKEWLLANKLSLNVTKSEYMYFGMNFRLSNLGKNFPIVIGNKQIKRVETTKYLGVHLDENLKWDEHINKLCAKVNLLVV